MTLAQGAVGRVVHHQVRCIIRYAEIEYAYDMRMDQAANDARFRQEALLVTYRQAQVQYFNGGIGIEIGVLCQVDFCESPPAQQANQLIIPQLLSRPVGHPLVPPL